MELGVSMFTVDYHRSQMRQIIFSFWIMHAHSSCATVRSNANIVNAKLRLLIHEEIHMLQQYKKSLYIMYITIPTKPKCSNYMFGQNLVKMRI